MKMSFRSEERLELFQEFLKDIQLIDPPIVFEFEQIPGHPAYKLHFDSASECFRLGMNWMDYLNGYELERSII